MAYTCRYLSKIKYVNNMIGLRICKKKQKPHLAHLIIAKIKTKTHLPYNHHNVVQQKIAIIFFLPCNEKVQKEWEWKEKSIKPPDHKLN